MVECALVRAQKWYSRRGTVLAKYLSTGSGARRKSAGETGDKGMIDSLSCHLALRVSDVTRQWMRDAQQWWDQTLR